MDRKEVIEKMELIGLEIYHNTNFSNRSFVIAPSGCQIGSIIVRDNRIYDIKWYGAGYSLPNLDSSFKYIAKWQYMRLHNKVLSDDGFYEFVKKARKIIRISVSKKLKWRRDNPRYKTNKCGERVIKSRRRFTPKTVTFVVGELILETLEKDV